MDSLYTKLSFDNISPYLELLSKTKSKASDYSFGNIWGWAPYFNLEWRFDDSLCWIRQTAKETLQWAPVGAWDSVKDWDSFPEFTSGATFIRVPEALCDLWEKQMPGRIERIEDRGNWDYLYLSSELSTLSGNRFHKKKNLLKQFQKNYEFTYHSLTEEYVESALTMQKEWCILRDYTSSEALVAENDAIERVLSKWGSIPSLCGGILFVDEAPIAYTIAEVLHDDTLIVHFEKALTTIKGGYQAINYHFCNDIGLNYTYLNREQDLGDEGLRQAKLSYNPVDYAKKYKVTIR